jgi:hypothetical protein
MDKEELAGNAKMIINLKLIISKQVLHAVPPSTGNVNMKNLL